jgi:hypothetical protein
MCAILYSSSGFPRTNKLELVMIHPTTTKKTRLIIQLDDAINYFEQLKTLVENDGQFSPSDFEKETRLYLMRIYKTIVNFEG